MTPRLKMLQSLGLAVAHGTGTTPDALEACQEELLKALSALWEMQGRTQRPERLVERLLAGEGA